MPQTSPETAILAFDLTPGDDVVRVHVLRASSTVTADVPYRKNHSQSLLQEVEQLLHQHQLTFTLLSGVLVVDGPVRFTITRLVALTANGLAWSLHIPVVRVPTLPSFNDARAALETVSVGDLLTPLYTQDPRITLSS